MSPRQWKWTVGLVVAIASGLLDVFVLGQLDPATFNLEQAKTGLVAGTFFAIKALLFYVKDHGKELAD